MHDVDHLPSRRIRASSCSTQEHDLQKPNRSQIFLYNYSRTNILTIGGGSGGVVVCDNRAGSCVTIILETRAPRRRISPRQRIAYLTWAC